MGVKYGSNRSWRDEDSKQRGLLGKLHMWVDGADSSETMVGLLPRPVAAA